MFESFTEMRSTAETIESASSANHHGLTNNLINIDHMGYGPGLEFGLSPWDFNIQPDVEFTEQVRSKEWFIFCFKKL